MILSAVYTVCMVYGILIMLFVIAVMAVFFIVISGGITDAWDTVKDIWQYKQTSALLGAGLLLAVFIVVGGGVSREGLTIADILLLQ